jgi:phage-related tail fiber protein
MANVDATKIHQGPGKLWLNVTVPTNGSRLVIDASGEPTAGTPLFAGATEGAATFVLAPKLEQITADQVAGAIDVVMTGEAESIEVTLKESDLAKLKNFVVHGAYTTGTDTNLPAGSQDYEEISFGGVLAIPKTSVAVISPRRDATGKFVVSQLYQAYQAEAIQLPFQRGKETTYKVKFEGLADPSRAAGDQVGKVYRQT